MFLATTALALLLSLRALYSEPACSAFPFNKLLLLLLLLLFRRGLGRRHEERPGAGACCAYSFGALT
jgi:hypothetical protein